jgi:large subunit ribosomal protein L25
MDVLTLDAQPRELGTSAARAVRREGDVPCVLYGPHAEPVHFRVPRLALRPLIYTSETHRVTIKVDGEEYDCILKDIAYHPVTDFPIHADFFALTAGESISMTIPVVLHGIAPGVQAGGVMMQSLNDLRVRCLPKDIPSQIEVDVSKLEIGDSIHVSDLSIEDVEIETDPSRTIVAIAAPTVEPVEEVDEGLLLEGEEAEGEGEEGQEPLADGESAGSAEG